MIKLGTNLKITLGLSLLLSFLSVSELLLTKNVTWYSGAAIMVYTVSVITWMALFLVNDYSHKTSSFRRLEKWPFIYWVFSVIVTFPIALLLILIQYYIRSPNMEMLNSSFWPKAINASLWATFISRVLQFARNYLIESKEKARENERLEKENIQTQFELFKQQVNPHFLFNSLNTLMDLIEDNKEDATHFLRQFSSVYRYVLNSTDKDLVSLKSELEFLSSYIHMLEKRFKEKLKINVDLPEEVMNQFLPPLTLQMLVENSIKHNEVSTEHPLFISILYENETVVIKNHIRPKTSFVASNGLGLKNLKYRFNHLMGQSLESVQINSDFVVKVPLTKDLVA